MGDFALFIAVSQEPAWPLKASSMKQELNTGSIYPTASSVPQLDPTRLPSNLLFLISVPMDAIPPRCSVPKPSDSSFPNPYIQ